MTIPGPRERSGRPSPFGLRQLALCFGLIAALICGAGLTVRAMATAAADRPVSALATGAALFTAAAVLRRRHRLRQAAGAREYAGLPAAAPAVAEPSLMPAYESMSPEEFEEAVAELCTRDGCSDVQVTGGAGDLGADVVATAPDGRRVVIQCKRYSPDHKVGSQELQRFGGTCFAVHGAHTATVVTTSAFTQPGAAYAAQCGIGCFGAEELAAWAAGTGPSPWEAER
ncbi:restriction endonuclease [Streptomyces syringium]|uniref:restriction endonuclease n=1 Tax=Streptomyces syringium TaxID=76729 RepID=UPI003AAA88E5